MSLEDTLEKVRKEIAQGKKWRAKELLKTDMGSRRYTPSLWQMYGELLLSMDDLMEAGEYLFLSKSSLSDLEQEAVDLYIGRHGKNGAVTMLNNTKWINRSEYPNLPSHVQARLRKLGATDELFKLTKKGPWSSALDRIPNLDEQDHSDLGGFSLKHKLLNFASYCSCLVFLLLAVIGLATVIKWIFGGG